jgi:RND family efflux transporter MFP subunit
MDGVIVTRLALLLPLLAAVAGCGTPTQSNTPAATAVIPVATDNVAPHAFPVRFEAGGVVVARTTVAIAARIVAVVQSVEVRPGDRVRAGQTLVVLDGRDLEARATEAASSVAVAEHGTMAAAAELDSAEALLTLARATHERIISLHARMSATPHELDQAVSELRAAEARVVAAQALRARSDAAIASARATVSATQVAASYAVLTAPFDGLVTEKLVDPGNLATPGVPLLRLDDTRGFRLDVRLDESRLAGIAPGDTVEIVLPSPRLPDGEPLTLAGRILEISRALDGASHAFLVKVEVPSRPELRSGVFARARFTAGTRDALSVADRAVVEQGQLPTVFVASADGRARMRVIRVAERDAGRVAVTAGLAAGERVIVAPPATLRDGDPVVIEGPR